MTTCELCEQEYAGDLNEHLVEKHWQLEKRRFGHEIIQYRCPCGWFSFHIRTATAHLRENGDLAHMYEALLSGPRPSLLTNDFIHFDFFEHLLIGHDPGYADVFNYKPERKEKTG